LNKLWKGAIITSHKRQCRVLIFNSEKEKQYDQFIPIALFLGDSVEDSIGYVAALFNGVVFSK